jgi:hypothetical protein
MRVQPAHVGAAHNGFRLQSIAIAPPPLHQVVPAGADPGLRCPECGKTFSRKGDLVYVLCLDPTSAPLVYRVLCLLTIFLVVDITSDTIREARTDRTSVSSVAKASSTTRIWHDTCLDTQDSAPSSVLIPSVTRIIRERTTSTGICGTITADWVLLERCGQASKRYLSLLHRQHQCQCTSISRSRNHNRQI